MRRYLINALVAGLVLIQGPAALAWSNQGHMVTGAIAFDDLDSLDPAAVSQIEKLMRSHPDKVRFERGLAGFSGEARRRRLFELMARWPDDARGGPYDHPAWHYWLRLLPSKSDPLAVPPSLLEATTGEAIKAYDLNLATAHDAFAPPFERAVALCWVFHLAGDMQQPLHAGHLISKRFPLSDRAGESDFIRADPAAAAMNLHQYWDDAIGGDGDDDANVEAVRVRLETEWPRGRFQELDGGRANAAAMRSWADESYALARSVAYAEMAFEGAVTKDAAPSVTPSYAQTRRNLGERRIALGGHRIADAVRVALSNSAIEAP